MIVYYNPKNGNIMGLSHKVIPGGSPDYFETDSPIAEKIFLGHEKAIKYYAVIREDGGYIKLRNQTESKTQTIRSKIIPFVQGLDFAELTVEQNVALKKISVKIVESSLSWWKTDSQYSLKKINIVACKKDNIYLPMWQIELGQDDLESLSFEMSYESSDDITFYTTQLFDSYKHEIKPS